VASGVIHLSLADAEETILNKCRNAGALDYVLLQKNNYRMTAEERYVYAILSFRPFVANNILNYLLGEFCNNTPSSTDNENSRGSGLNTLFYTDKQSEMQYSKLYQQQPH
jgi:CBS domain-containing protein